MAEFEVDGQTYRSGRMNARTQFHVLRRMAPILGPLQSLAANQGGANALPVFADAIGGLSDEATDYILDHCLAVVERKQGEAWARIKPPNVGALMFQDIDLMAMLQIAAHVLRDNYSELFQRGLAGLSGGATAST
ncbi:MULTISPECIES: phage tail assembly chaperone [Methylobacterium]|uniref:Bacteriophage protein n=1 Tax=Methylobacterium jeotgali TaxID=381630 RepID=A0ABQ4T2Z5_9HYPH|nr:MULTISPECIES: hypothetical protein [Methylobacterium]PIU06910.1 MAG: hypothetical protein COT56_07195 [Methylobacterium sp. CG09_land_8_20_14_0_10_71_15]PIU16122.1 MAG: hypothetical protein COT28_01515 [Methylobacterium sp. CG08_land_8_20_14_0_20_71_15]GBU18024.1 hypothetical protein AwMethylo_22390 [Methylobacterium sp.]GJE08630.1 hypothetical protein AOPFMNJM_3973 [Methylobacterium jeotgali]